MLFQRMLQVSSDISGHSSQSPDHIRCPTANHGGIGHCKVLNILGCTGAFVTRGFLGLTWPWECILLSGKLCCNGLIPLPSRVGKTFLVLVPYQLQIDRVFSMGFRAECSNLNHPRHMMTRKLFRSIPRHCSHQHCPVHC